MDTNFWVVHTTHGPYRVDERTANTIRAKISGFVGMPYQENQEIGFVDAAGSQCYIVLATYLGCLESTKEQRAYDRILGAQLDKEKEDDEPSWR